MSLPQVLAQIEQACLRSGRNPAEVKLVAVTKGHPAQDVQQKVLKYGPFALGESRVQEALAKMQELQGQTWHLIGPLQRNKARFASSFALVHSLDSWRLAEFLSAKSVEQQVRQPVLIEVNVGREPQKHGFLPEELPELMPRMADLPGLQLQGFMTVAPEVADPQQARPIFAQLSGLADLYGLPERSMGMSGDFEVAVEEGATLVRVGRKLFEP